MPYVATLGLGFALDDVPIIATNPLVHHWSGVVHAFQTPYWPAAAGAAMYRPLVLASFAVDWQTGQLFWLHLVNVLWHVAVSVTVAALARDWSASPGGGLVAGLAFAVHPVHVEAVANLVGRAELMAALFALLSVYAALAHDRLAWSLVALVLGLLSKETAATVPGLIVAGWMTGVGRSPSRTRMLRYVAGWGSVAVAYGIVRWTLLHGHSDQVQSAPVFVGAGFAATRVTAIAAFADIARLLAFPLKLRVDYSPAERTLVSSLLDPRFALGLACFVLWASLVGLAWRRGWRTTSFGLLWIAVAVLPVSNLLFASGVLVAERALYLPSAGLAIALGDSLSRLPGRTRAVVLATLCLLCGARTAQRVPVWRNSDTVLQSVRHDSQRSYVGPMDSASMLLAQRRPEEALAEFRIAASRTTGAPKLLTLGADAALTLGRSRLADSLLGELDRMCSRCRFYLDFEARAALARGDSAVADSLRIRLSALTGRRLSDGVSGEWSTRPYPPDDLPHARALPRHQDADAVDARRDPGHQQNGEQQDEEGADQLGGGDR